MENFRTEIRDNIERKCYGDAIFLHSVSVLKSNFNMIIVLLDHVSRQTLRQMDDDFFSRPN